MEEAAGGGSRAAAAAFETQCGLSSGEEGSSAPCVLPVRVKRLLRAQEGAAAKTDHRQAIL